MVLAIGVQLLILEIAADLMFQG